MPVTRRIFLIALAAIFALQLSPNPAVAEDCKLVKREALDLLESRNGSMLVRSRLKGQVAYFMVDTGGAGGDTIYDDVVDKWKLGRGFSTDRIVGAGGVESNATAYDDVSKGLYFILPRPPYSDPREVGSIGSRIAADEDMEIDFHARKLNLFSRDHCDGKVVYWAPDYNDRLCPTRHNKLSFASSTAPASRATGAAVPENSVYASRLLSARVFRNRNVSAAIEAGGTCSSTTRANLGNPTSIDEICTTLFDLS